MCRLKCPNMEKSQRKYTGLTPLLPPLQKEMIALSSDGCPMEYAPPIFDYLKEGDKLDLNGPHGDFFLRESDREMICIAGGSGLAPINSILYEIRDKNIRRKATFFFGCVEKRDLYYTDEMKAFEKQIPDFRFVPALSAPREADNWPGRSD